MFKRVALAVLATLFLVASAQADFIEYSGKIRRFTYHYATGTITETTNNAQSFGPDVAWDSTAFTGSFYGSDLATAPPEEVVDWGDVEDGTVVNGFQIGYAADAPDPVDYQVNFYTGNGFGDASATLARFDLTGLPTNGDGTLGGFVIDVDLEGGFEFTITGPDTDGFAGTDFEYGYIPLAGAGTGSTIGTLISTGGFGEEDAFDVYEPGAQADGGPYAGSLFFGGTPFAQMHMRLYTNAIPEPTSAALLGLGVLGLALVRRRKK